LKKQINISRNLFISSCLFLATTAVLFLGCKKEQGLSNAHPTSYIDGLSSLKPKAAVRNSLVESSDFMVMDNNSESVYLGDILSAKDLYNLSEFNPISGYGKLPIRISCSFPGQDVSDVITVPRLSTFRQAVQNILRKNNFDNAQIGSFLYNYRPFYDYDEIRQEFGYNLSVKGLFSSSSSSTTHSVTTIKKRYGFVASFELVTFTVDMAIPRMTELISDNDIQLLAATNQDPVYINSISYGQKGIFSVETDSNIEETNAAFEKVTKGIFKKTTETLTEYEKHLIDQSTIYLYLAGGPNAGSPMVIDSYATFIQYVTSLGNFSADNPGYPVSFRMRRVQDNTLFKLPIISPN
jgi:thiol-activated cytolysin